jgi:GNAT superfamily N-acetyltransferase
MSRNLGIRLTAEAAPKPEEVRFLDERLYEFNIAATGIADGNLMTFFLRAADGALLGGAFGWSWGETCYLRHLFVPALLRRQGYGTRLMAAVEAEARARGCRQIMLETHSFQAPDFYRRLGFEVTGRVENYPRGHQYLTLVKHLDPAPAA